MQDSRKPFLITLSILLIALLTLSGWQPYDRGTWLMEIFPILIVFPILWATHKKFPLTTLLYGLIFVHATILMVGGKYTYARVPLGFWLQEALHLTRNPYDKIGHFFQGFVPALACREIFLRGNYLRGNRMLRFLIICVALAISATYELIEWWSALAMGSGADDFLGTQGDPWDTQSDMFFALIGACSALLILSRAHNRGLKRFAATDTDIVIKN